MRARAGIAFMAALGVIGAQACTYLIALFVALTLMAEPGDRTLPVWFYCLFGAIVVAIPVAATSTAVGIVRAIEGRSSVSRRRRVVEQGEAAWVPGSSPGMTGERVAPVRVVQDTHPSHAPSSPDLIRGPMPQGEASP